jgi:2-polyprenyl-3-methyl-5-hydroxy-6-metoxy-1,4-benzoquinol methylase
MFDVVVSMEVLEHINNPLEEINNIYKLLRKGGLFYFTTPNFNALERYLLKSDYNIISYPEHLCYYTKKTINYLLTNNGFRKKRLETTGISLTRIQTSRRASKEAFISASSTDERIRNSLERNKLLQIIKKGVNFILSLLGVGNSLNGWYERV